MKVLIKHLVILFVVCFVIPAAIAGNGKGDDNKGGNGDIYGDLYVIDRDSNGVPTLNEDGCVQPNLLGRKRRKNIHRHR